LSRITSSIGEIEAILVETEKRRRDSRPGRVRGSIGGLLVQWMEDGGCGGGRRKRRRRKVEFV
jgi:hypothetical protein